MIDIAIAVLSSAAVAGFVVWLLREWISARLRASIKHEYDRKLEDIRNEYSKELARLNGTLQESLDFKATRFRMVYERKIAALCEAFGRLAKLEKSLGEYVSYWGEIRGPERTELRQRFAKELGEFEDFFVPNRIFFPASLAERITDVKNRINKIALEFMVSVERPGDMADSRLAGLEDKWQKANEYAGKELPQIRREIESAIRFELGEETPKSAVVSAGNPPAPASSHKPDSLSK
jgi:hypothetical protein